MFYLFSLIFSLGEIAEVNFVLYSNVTVIFALLVCVLGYDRVPIQRVGEHKSRPVRFFFQHFSNE